MRHHAERAGQRARRIRAACSLDVNISASDLDQRFPIQELALGSIFPCERLGEDQSHHVVPLATRPSSARTWTASRILASQPLFRGAAESQLFAVFSFRKYIVLAWRFHNEFELSHNCENSWMSS